MISVLALVVAMGVVSCSSSGSGTQPPTASPHSASVSPASPSASPTPTVPTQLTGSQLAVALLTPDQFPAGFAIGTSATLDSGTSLTTAAPLHNPQHLTCAQLITTLWRPGFGETAMATNLVYSNASGESYAEAVYQFASSGQAAAFYQDLSATWSACHVIVADITKNLVGRMTVVPQTAPSGLGAQDFSVSMVGIEARRLNQTVTVVRDGDDVFLGSASRLGASPPTDLDITKLLHKLIDAVAAAG